MMKTSHRGHRDHREEFRILNCNELYDTTLYSSGLDCVGSSLALRIFSVKSVQSVASSLLLCVLCALCG